MWSTLGYRDPPSKSPLITAYAVPAALTMVTPDQNRALAKSLKSYDRKDQLKLHTARIGTSTHRSFASSSHSGRGASRSHLHRKEFDVGALGIERRSPTDKLV